MQHSVAVEKEKLMKGLMTSGNLSTVDTVVCIVLLGLANYLEIILPATSKVPNNRNSTCDDHTQQEHSLEQAEG